MNEKEVQEVKRYLNVIKRAVAIVEGMLDNSDGGLMEALAAPQPTHASVPNVVFQTAPHQVAPPQPVVVEVQPTPPIETTPPPKLAAARKKHIGDLMAIDCWPEAVPSLLANKEPTEKEKVKRANMVIDMLIDRKIDGMKFLDFGCGEGHIAEQMVLRGATSSIGYDIEPKDTWKAFTNAKFTTNFSDLAGSFDMVMAYDVLDHSQNPEETMRQIRGLLKDTGVVYVRCHPWTSSHAQHLHILNPELNKAYLHLFLKYDELYELAQKPPMFTRMETNPLEAYHWWFKDFDIKRERKMDGPISEFFRVPAFKELLANEQGIDVEKVDGLLELMKIQFVDYILVPKND